MSQEIKELLLAAFCAGNYRVNNEHPKETAQVRFEEWYNKSKILEPLRNINAVIFENLVIEKDKVSDELWHAAIQIKIIQLMTSKTLSFPREPK